MNDVPPTSKVLPRAMCATAAVLGITVLCAVVGWLPPPTITGANLPLLAVLAAAALWAERRQLVFARGVEISIINVPLLIAVVALPPGLTWSLAVATSAIGFVGMDIREGWSRTLRVVFAGAQVMLQGALVVLVHELARGLHILDAARSGEAFPVILLAATLVGLQGVAFAWDEYVQTGRLDLVVGIDHLAEIVLATIAVVMVAPYLTSIVPFSLLLVGIVGTAYGAMWMANSQQREKRRGDHLKETFSRYVPEGVVDDNVDSMQEIELGGEQRVISVLFCDIRGFTSWAESREATEIIEQLNVLLGELSSAVMAESGTLDKYMGDGLMAFWGAPLPAEDHADRAARAGLDMLARLDAVNRRRTAEGHEPFALGVGVHTGPAVVGNVGHERRLDYTAIGDTVNTTARLEAATKEVGSPLLLSSQTVECLGPSLRERSIALGDVRVKGRTQPVGVWALGPATVRSGAGSTDASAGDAAAA